MCRLINCYPAAYKDFYGLPSRPPCVYKSGPAWRENHGPEPYRIIREARPVHDHPIAGKWRDIGTRIYQFLDSKGVMWTSIDPVGFAEVGEMKPFCALLMWIGVKPKSLRYSAAVAAAEAIKKILAEAGFPEIEAAFRESVVTRSAAQSPKLLSFKFNPLFDPDPAEVIKPFTPMLGLSIAPLETPYYEGTGALYLRISTPNKRIVLLTAAHVARPPNVYNPPTQKIVALGDKGYRNAITSMLSAIRKLASSINDWNDQIGVTSERQEYLKLVKMAQEKIRKIGELKPENDADKFSTPALRISYDNTITSMLSEVCDLANKIVVFPKMMDEKTADKRQKYLDLVNEAKKNIREIAGLESDITKFGTLEQRSIGSVLYVQANGVGEEPNNFTRDWALIELDEEKIDLNSFKGNKVYIGTFSISGHSNII